MKNIKCKFNKACLSFLLVSLLTLVCTNTAHSATLSFSYTDPVGDWYGAIGQVDLTGMQFTFDNLTGDYEVILTADHSRPFLDHFRINVNLFNPDTGDNAHYPSFFSDTMNDFNLSIPATSMPLTGNDSRLLMWKVGNRVAVSGPDPLGLPDDGAYIRGFGSGVIDLTLTNSLGYFVGDGIDNAFSIIKPVPIPPALLLFGTGFLGLIGLRKKLIIS